MNGPLWDRIQEIYYSTLPVPLDGRSAFLAAACDQEPFLVGELTTLLEADDSSAGFLESPVSGLVLKIISSDSRNTSSDPNFFSVSLEGSTVDQRYLVERALGHGGMGKVYFARDLTLHHRPVVIKVLLNASVQDAYVVRKFRQEVEALARIDHPGVVGVLGAGELPEGRPYIVMQYINGVTLRSQIPSEGMELERAALILQQAGAALDDVHEKGIFHRDLKPENVMLQTLKNGAELVKLVDFGIAKVKDSVVAPSTVERVSVGTVLYMSPEQLRGGERITAASDVYSLGVISYEILTGRRPFNPTSAPQLLEMHREGVRVKPVDLRVNLSTEAQAIILRALSFERADRYQSAAEFSDSLARALMDGEEAAPRTVAISSYSDNLGRTVYDDANTEGSSNATKPAVLGRIANPENRQIRLGRTQLAIIGGFLLILVCFLTVRWVLLSGSGGAPESNTNQNSLLSQKSLETEPVEKLTTHSFIYSLTVQRMRNNRRFQNPFQSTDQDTFDTGDRFRLNLLSSNPGYVYVFNEGTPEPLSSSFSIIYPVPSINHGSATLGADQWVRSNWNEFQGEAGTENLWIVWSTAPVPALESAKAEAFKHKGVLTGESLDSVKAFLTKQQDESRPKINREKSSQQTTVRGTGDVVVKMFQLKHR